NSVTIGAADGSYVGITASSTDVNGPDVTYRLADSAGGRFAIDRVTGVITVADSGLIDGIQTSFTITIQAMDGASGVVNENFTIDVTSPPPQQFMMMTTGGQSNEGGNNGGQSNPTESSSQSEETSSSASESSDATTEVVESETGDETEVPT